MPTIVKNAFSRPGTVAHGALLLVLLLGFGWSAVFLTAPYKLALVVTDLDVGVALGRVGLDAEPLAAAGVSAQQAQAVVSAARSYLAEHLEDITQANTELGAATAQVENLERVVRSGLATQQQLQGLATARATLATATAACDAALNALFAAAAQGLSAGQRATIGHIRAARAGGWDLPVKYQTVTREEAGWVALRDALSHERIAERLGQTIDPEVQQLILAENSNPAVASAATSLNSNLTTLTATWNTAVFP